MIGWPLVLASAHAADPVYAVRHALPLDAFTRDDAAPAIAVAAGAPAPGAVWRPQPDVELVWVPGGRFAMGAPSSDPQRRADETPVHEVAVEGLWVLRTEVSQALYERVLRRQPAVTGRQYWAGRDQGPCHVFAGQRLAGPDLPVICVSWFDAVAFANALSALEGLSPAYSRAGAEIVWHAQADGYRLLTEAEWEHAARGGAGEDHFAGHPGEFGLCRVANVSDASARGFGWPWEHVLCSDRHPALAPVGTFDANAYGLHDMTGNVWEWVWDWYDPTAYADAERGERPRGPDKGAERVFRGGSWMSRPASSRLTFRNSNAPEHRRTSVGLRVARPGTVASSDGSR